MQQDQEAVVEKAHNAEGDPDQLAQVPGHGEDGGDAQLGLGVHGDAAAQDQRAQEIDEPPPGRECPQEFLRPLHMTVPLPYEFAVSS